MKNLTNQRRKKLVKNDKFQCIMNVFQRLIRMNSVLDRHKRRTKNKTMSVEYEYINESSIDSELICSICQAPFNNPCCAPCGEIYCRECISRWIQTRNGSCPHCRQTISIKGLNNVPRSLQNMLDRLQVKCIACG
jgi:hypothetical protein